MPVSKDQQEMDAIRKDIADYITKRTGKKFYAHIVLHSNTQAMPDGRTNISTAFLSVSNLKLDTDPFELVKIMLLNFKQNGDAAFVKIFGLIPGQNASSNIQQDYQ